MLYFQHTELAAQYHVSPKTVRNWIDATKQGKLNLTLHVEGNSSYVANTAGNIATITELTESRRKYRNTRTAKVVTPKPDFYTLYSDDQIYDIISNLEIHHEIPRQYNYFDGGAKRWEEYVERLAAENTMNMLTGTTKLLEVNQNYVDDLLGEYSRVNVIDVGVGNAYPTRELLAHLIKQNKLGRYIALDISPSMLEIAETNIKTWFGDAVPFEGYEYDINYERFSKLLASEYTKNDADNTVNLVLLLGGTLSNMRHPDSGYRMVHDSMGIKDLLVHTTKLDTMASRRYFDFNFEPGNTALSPNHRLIFDLLNIDESFYDIEMGYDHSISERYIRVRLKVSITVQFVSKDGKREVVLNKDDTILLWRGLQQTATDVMEQFDRCDYYPLHISQTSDQEYILTISRVKHNQSLQ